MPIIANTPPQRPEPPMAGDERTQLTGFLDFQRATTEREHKATFEAARGRPFDEVAESVAAR
ncbi:hypothetical protein [Amycolatopsis sulphurea]|nr:hypothetical protein [Amycolatopsis sulphurea]